MNRHVLFLAAMLGWFDPAATFAASLHDQQLQDRYLQMQLVKITDQHGFGRPMTAATLLLPKGWKVDSSVRWTGDVGCPENAVHLTLKARSPDGRLAFEVFPAHVWKWSDDPAVLQSTQQAMAGFGVKGCDVLPPYDAVDYLQHVFLPRWRAGSTLSDLGRLPELAQALQVEHRAMTGGGPAMLQTDFDVGLATIESPRAGGTDEEWVIATVMRIVAPMPSLGAMWGGGYPSMANSYSMSAMLQFAARAPKGELERHARLFETIYRSFRGDPQWEAALMMFYQNVAAIQRQGAADRARIISESNREIGEIISQTWAARQASQDRTWERQTQALRSVETWIDPATQASIELSSGYRGAWSNGLGDYILSDVPDFNPGRVLGGNWTELREETR